MASVTTGIGLISGIKFREIVDQLINIQKAPIDRMQERQKGLIAIQTAFKALSANLLTLTTSATQLNTSKNFASFQALNSDPDQLTVTVKDGASVSSLDLRAVRLATAQQYSSIGFANTDQQAVGAGTITISAGGRADSDTALSTLNGGAGVRRGTIRITDRSGASADVDLTGTATVTDVIDAINRASGISVTAEGRGDHLVLTDHTGQTASNLIVTDRLGGHAAADLGIGQSVASGALSGSSIYQATGAFTLSSLNDGNHLSLAANAADLRITLTDVAATALDIDLTGAVTLNDVVNRINSHVDNAGKLTAAIANGRLVLTDNTGGGGAQPLSVTDLNGSHAAAALGLSGSAAGNTLTGGRLVAGINSVLLRNLRGGQGIDQLGQVALTDRTGRTATINLAGAQSLDEVLTAINEARDAGNVRLALRAKLSASGNRLVIEDTSGASTANLSIADVGGSTLATQLGITVNAAQNSVTGAALGRRFVNEATLLTGYAPGGGAVRRGNIAITDSTGQQHFVSITDAAKSIGDVIAAISSGTNGRVTGALNDTGDGFMLVDQAGGAGQLNVAEAGGFTAADLRILGTGQTGGDGKSRIVSRQATIVTVTASDTLATLKDKLNAARAGMSAAIYNDGTSFAPWHLALTSGSAGAAGRLVVDEAGLALGLDLRSRGDNALLQIGADASSAYVLSSATNHIDSAAPGVDVDLKNIGSQPAHVDIVRDAGKVADMVKKFVDGYNDTVKKIAELTKFDFEGNSRGALQGEGLPLRLQSVLSDLVIGDRFGPKDGTVRSLSDLGISLNGEGKLQVDSFGLQIKVGQKGDDVNKFFLDPVNGFAAKLKKTLESFTDPLTGKIAEQTNSLQASVDNLERRISTLNGVLETRHERLLRQYINLESILGQLQSQQSTLTQLASAVATAKAAN